MIKQFLEDENGQTLVEYGFIIVFVALVAISVVTIFGTRIKNTLYDKANAQLPG